MTAEQTYQCSRCGKQEVPNIRYLACGSTSQWEKLNYPAPNTTFTTKDDIKIWKIALCDSCMPLSYKVFLQNGIKKTTKTLGICLLLLTIGVFGVWSGAAGSGLVYPLRMLLGFALTIALIIGVIGFPVNLIILIVNSIRLRNLNQNGFLAEKNKDKGFIGEGERIIKEMEKSQFVEIKGDFPLPKFTELKDLPLTDKEKEKILNEKFRRGERSIISVAFTMQELEKALPQEWLQVLKISKEVN